MEGRGGRRRRANMLVWEVWYAPRAKNWVKVNILTYTGPDNALNLVDKTTLVIKSLNVAPP